MCKAQEMLLCIAYIGGCGPLELNFRYFHEILHNCKTILGNMQKLTSGTLIC